MEKLELERILPYYKGRDGTIFTSKRIVNGNSIPVNCEANYAIIADKLNNCKASNIVAFDCYAPSVFYGNLDFCVIGVYRKDGSKLGLGDISQEMYAEITDAVESVMLTFKDGKFEVELEENEKIINQLGGSFIARIVPVDFAG